MVIKMTAKYTSSKMKDMLNMSRRSPFLKVDPEEKLYNKLVTLYFLRL